MVELNRCKIGIILGQNVDEDFCAATPIHKNPGTAVEPFTGSIPGEKFEGWNIVKGCPNVAITGPTNSPDEIVKAANQMTNSGSGRFDVGLAWSWRLLSPNWSTQWATEGYPAPNTEKRRKKLIFMTDAKTGATAREMSKELDWGHNMSSKVGFEHMVEVCRKAKEDEIEIYMLQITGNPHATSYLKDCASSPDHYYSVSKSSDVNIVFDDIVGELEAELRIVR